MLMCVPFHHHAADNDHHDNGESLVCVKTWHLAAYAHIVLVPPVFMEPPASPLGIPSWLWLTLLTFFMLFIIWLSLRNLSHLLPLRIQHVIQDFSDRIGLARHIRLLERDDPSTATNGNNGTPFGIDLDASSDDDDDDELPLASRLSREQTTFSKTGRQRKLDRIVRMFSGGIQHARGYGNLPNNNNEDDEESVLDLPNLPSSSRYKPRTKSAVSSTSPPTLFRANSQEGDAPPLPLQFHFTPSREPSSPAGGPLSPSMDRTYPRSPLRSPSLSRTPSLVAILEETAVSPRTSLEQARQLHTQSPGQLESAGLERHGSGSSQSQELQDWASARS